MGSCSLGAEDWNCSGQRGLGRLGGLGKGLGVGMIDALSSLVLRAGSRCAGRERWG